MYTINDETVKFIKAFGYKNLAIRTFPDKKKKLSGIEKRGNLIRCNTCGEFKAEKEVFMGYKNRPICKACSPVKLDIKVDELDKWSRLICFKNKYCNHGVHVSINAAHTDKEVQKVYAQFFEVDDKPLEEQWRIIEKLELEPSLIVQTRKSYHVYYLIKDGKLKRFREIQERLAYTFGGDMQKKNESTCMRIPGFYHNKKEPIMVKLVKYNPSLIYTQSELVSGLSLLRVPEKPKQSYKMNIDNCKDELFLLAYSHIREYIEYETRDKIIMRCLNTSHKDSNPSAVFFKDSLRFYCSGCGYSHSLYEVATEQGWRDIVNLIDERVKTA